MECINVISILYFHLLHDPFIYLVQGAAGSIAGTVLPAFAERHGKYRKNKYKELSAPDSQSGVII